MLSTDRKKVLQTPHYGWCGRCGRYFTALIKYILLLVVTSLPTRAYQSRLKRLLGRGADLRRPGGPNGIRRALETVCMPIEARPTGPLEEARGRNSCLPLPG